MCSVLKEVDVKIHHYDHHANINQLAIDLYVHVQHKLRTMYLIITIQWNVNYRSEQVTGVLTQQKKIPAKLKGRDCSEHRPGAGNLQTIEEKGFHYFPFEETESCEDYKL